MNFRICCLFLLLFISKSNYAISQSENFTDIFSYAGFILGKNKTELKDSFICNNFDSKEKVPDSICRGGIIFLSNKQLLSVNNVQFRDLILSTDSSGKIISLVLFLSSSLKDNKTDITGARWFKNEFLVLVFNSNPDGQKNIFIYDETSRLVFWFSKIDEQIEIGKCKCFQVCKILY